MDILIYLFRSYDKLQQSDTTDAITDLMGPTLDAVYYWKK